MSGFTFGGSNGVGPTNTATGARLNVGTPGVAPAPASSFSFGSTPAATPAPPSGGTFSFGNTAATSTPAPATGRLNFGYPSNAATSTAPAPATFSFGPTTMASAPAVASTEGKGVVSFGSTPAPATTSSTAFSFGAGAPAPAPANVPAPATTTSTAFSFGAGAPAPAPASAPAPSTTSTAFSFGSGAPAPANAPAPAVANAPAPAPANAPAPVSEPSKNYDFGGGNSTVSAPALGSPASISAKPAAASNLFGFDRGSAAPAAATSAPAPAPSGGFSFGSAPLPSPATVAGDPSSTAVMGAPGGTEKNGTESSLLASTAKEVKFSLQNAPPAEYLNKTVEEIVNDWNAQLEQDATVFTNAAVRVGEWDTHLRNNQADITTLADQVQRLLLAQEELRRTMGTVNSNQEELDQALSTLETQVNSMFEQHKSRPPGEADLEREYMFELAVDVEQQLSTMLGTLKGLVQSLNDNLDGSNENGEAGDGSGTVAKILKILNAHHQSLQWLDTSATKIEVELAAVSRQLKNSI